MLEYYAFLAILNGLCVGAGRSINGRLGVEVGAIKASLWNHVVGFFFLTFILLFTEKIHLEWIFQVPPWIYLGGIFGAFFVTLTSYIIPRLGNVKTSLLIISGEMTAGVIIDFWNGNSGSPIAQLIGISLIILGVYLSKLNGARRLGQ